MNKISLSGENILRVTIFCIGIFIGVFIYDRLVNKNPLESTKLLNKYYIREVSVIYDDNVYELYYYNPLGNHIRVIEVVDIPILINSEEILHIEENKLYIKGCYEHR